MIPDLKFLLLADGISLLHDYMTSKFGVDKLLLKVILTEIISPPHASVVA